MGLTRLVEDADADSASLQSELRILRDELKTLATQLGDAQRRSDELWDVAGRDSDERVALAGLPRARLLSDAIHVDGTPSQRLRIRRRRVGGVVEQPFSRWLGVTRCVSRSPDVRSLWDALLACESKSTDDVLRGGPSTILDVPGGTVALPEPNILQVSLRNVDETADRHQPPRAYRVLAVPRCAYALPSRKLRNFGHWLLDCVPHAVALSMVSTDAHLLVPEPLKRFQRDTLLLAGIDEERLVPWDGAPLRAERLLVLESDGRAGGGRPLSPLLELRRRVAPATAVSRSRRIYVSRRDARPDRQWVRNEAAVEAVFADNGFEIVTMEGCPLDEQVRIFRDAAVVAGVSGAGLTNIIFSPPETHVIVLLTDSLIRWYAAEAGARSLWASGERIRDGQLSALGDSPRFHVHLAASYDQWCHSLLAGDEIPRDHLTAFLDDVMSRVENG